MKRSWKELEQEFLQLLGSPKIVAIIDGDRYEFKYAMVKGRIRLRPIFKPKLKR